MEKRPAHLLFASALLLIAATAGAATPDLCQSDPECHSHTEKALRKVGHSDYEHALSDFQAAYARRPEPRLLLNIGRCYFRMSRPEDALSYYRRFVGAPGFEPEPELTKAAQDFIAEAEAAIARVKLQRVQQGRLLLSVSEPGAQVFIDGKRMEDAPLQRSLDLPVGLHRIQVVGAKTESKEVVLQSGREVGLRFESEPVSAVARAPRPTWRLATGGVTLGLGAVLIGLGAGALVKDGQCVTTLDTGLCAASLGADGVRAAQVYDSQSVGIGLLSSGATLLVVGAVLLALPGPRRAVAATSGP